jgi:hypothetical protein
MTRLAGGNVSAGDSGGFGGLGSLSGVGAPAPAAPGGLPDKPASGELPRPGIGDFGGDGEGSGTPLPVRQPGGSASRGSQSESLGGGSLFSKPNPDPAHSPALGSPAFGSPAFGSPAPGSPAFGSPALGSPALGNNPFADAPIPSPAGAPSQPQPLPVRGDASLPVRGGGTLPVRGGGGSLPTRGGNGGNGGNGTGSPGSPASSGSPGSAATGTVSTGSNGGSVTVPPSLTLGQEQRLPIFDMLESDWFRRSGTSSDPGTAASSGGSWNSPADDGWRAARVAAVPNAGETTTAGLPKRVPRANLVPGSVGNGEVEAPEAAPQARSADEIRNRMSSFQRGVRQARAAAPQIEEP